MDIRVMLHDDKLLTAIICMANKLTYHLYSLNIDGLRFM